MIYRDYQSDCSAQVLAALPTERSALVVLPTGVGKSVIIYKMVEDYLQQNPGAHVLVLVHKKELIEQLTDRLAPMPGRTLVVEQAERIELQEASAFDIAVCSIQTLQSRPEMLDGIPVDLIVIDETHRALADGYMDVLTRLGMTAWPGPDLIGLTATDFRTDTQPLSFLYNTVAYHRDIVWGMKEGWLAPIKSQRIAQTEIDERGRLIRRRLDDDEMLDAVESTFREHCMDGQDVIRPTLIMASSIDNGREIADHLTTVGIQAEMVDSKMDQTLRAQHILDFREGRLDVLCAMNVLIEGFDAPRASCMFWVRNTQSPVIFMQGLGRITRPYFEDQEVFARFNASTHAEERRDLIAQSAKPDALFFDFTDTASQYNLVTLSSLFGLHRDFDFEGEFLLETLELLDELEEQYSIISAASILDASQIGQVTEDAELWRQAVTPNTGVPDSAELVYTKHRSHWLLTFPITHPKYDCAIPHLIRIQPDARGVWQAKLGQPEVWREWYWNGGQRKWATKYYKGQVAPDPDATIKIRGRDALRYFKIGGMPFIQIAEAHDKATIFAAVEKYIFDTYGEKLRRLLHRNAPWRERSVSDRQHRIVKKMRKAGIALPEELDAGVVSVLTDRYFLGFLQPTKLKKRK